MVFQPALLVSTSGPSGTSVACSGLVSATNLRNRVIRISFYIVFGSDKWFEIVHILCGDVSLVRPGMNRDSLSTEKLTIAGYFFQIGIVASTCISKCGKLVYVDA